MHRVSVSEALLACRCPRLLAYRLSGREDAWLQGQNEAEPIPGALFHRELAAPFHQAMSSGNNSLQKEMEAILRNESTDLLPSLLAFLEKRFFLPLLRNRGKSLRGRQAKALGKGVEKWAEFLAELLSRAGGYDVNRMFHDPESELRAETDPGDGEPVLLTGRYDALVFDPAAGEGVLLEFKSGGDRRFQEAFRQVALYGMLIRRMTGVSVRAMVCRLDGEDPVAEYSASELQDAEKEIMEAVRAAREVKKTHSGQDPVVAPAASNAEACRECSYFSQCGSDWEDAAAAEREDAEAEAEEGLSKIVELLRSLNIGVHPSGYVAGPRFLRYKVLPGKGTTVRKLLNKSEDLQVALSSPVPPIIRTQPGYVSLDVPRRSYTDLTLEQVWRSGASGRPDSRAAFPLGMGIEGDVVWADLCEPTMTSILLGGTAGSGKSMFLRAASVGLALNATPRELRLTLIDPKRVSFTDLQHIPHLEEPVLMEPEDALQVLQRLTETMEERYRILQRHGEADLDGYNQRHQVLPHHVVLIDEYADLTQNKENREQLEGYVQRLGQKGRAAGVHLILSTQRPDSKTVTPAIRANLQLKAALKVTTASNSRVILDESGAERLVGHGDMLIGGSVEVQRLQAPLLTPREIEWVTGARRR